jgi:hypothetical protein
VNGVYSFKYLHHFDVFLCVWSGNHKRERESGLPPATEMHAACTLHHSSIFMYSVSVPQYHTTANAPYHSQLAANFKCSNHPTFLLEGLSLQLDARLQTLKRSQLYIFIAFVDYLFKIKHSCFFFLVGMKLTSIFLVYFYLHTNTF